MSINGLMSSRTNSGSDFAGIGGDTGVCAFLPNTRVAGSTTAVEERLAERKRIAQQLHDTLLQGFFAVSMQIHAAVDHLPADCAAKARFSDVLQLLDRVLDQGRRAVQGLRSPNERIAPLGEAFAGVPSDLGFPS